MNTLLYNKCLSILQEKNKYKQNLNQSFDIFDRTNFNIDFPSNLSSDRLQVLNNKTTPLTSFHREKRSYTPSLFLMSQAASKVGYKYGIHLYFPIQEWVFESSQKFARNEGGVAMKGQKPKQSILQCRKNIKLFYGALDTKKLQKIIEQAAPKQSTFAQNFFSLIESRLDVVLYRSGFAKTIRAARQIIRHSKVYVNNRCCRVSSTLCKPGDIITFSKYNDKEVILNEVKNNKKVIKNNITDIKKNNTAILLLALVCLRRVTNQLDISSNFYSKIGNLVASSFLPRSGDEKHNTLLLRITNSKKRLKLSYKNDLPSKSNLEKKGNKIDLMSKFLEKLKDQNKISSNLWNNGISSFGAQLAGNLQNLMSRLNFVVSINKKDSQREKDNSFINYINKTPSHLEISKISNSIIFLYSPQKISLPFHIDIDVLRKI